MPAATEGQNTNDAPRYVIGIDLGTTNSAVAWVDTQADTDASAVHTLPIPQLIAAGQVEQRDTLPSFHYEPASKEFSDADLQLPWESSAAAIVGCFARDHGIQVPGRMISSAKSWLCHPGVDRTAGILPWQGGDEVQRLSPVDVSSRILNHLRQAWEHRFPHAPMADQTVVLTIPASFDEVARNLTIQAAQKAGLRKVLLIEEPQAAFYAWIDRHKYDWESLVQPGQKILVCDVGGGTTDFTLIRVKAGTDGKVVFHRVAVGEHLILGGDNLDLALAHFLEEKFRQEGTAKLTARQWSVLVRLARQVKETCLDADPPDDISVSLPGSGSRLIGSALQTRVTSEEVRRLLLEGFLPQTSLDDDPVDNQSGFREFGLPYASDSAISRYLARFLRTHAETALENELLNDDHNPARPDIVLYNGGLFESPLLKQQLTNIVAGWFSTSDSSWQPNVLTCNRLDLAVAHGAACYGLVSRGIGVRISAGLPRSYYLGVAADSGPSAICIAPAGTEPGTQLPSPERVFQLQTGRPVEFPVYYSGTRLTDAVGTLVEADPEQLTALPPIRTVIRSSRDSSESTQEISVHARLSEIGTLDLWCENEAHDERWKLQFDVRSAVQTDRSAHVSDREAEGIVGTETLESVRQILQSVFGEEADQKPGGLARRIGREIGMSRVDWPTSLLREMWQILIDLEPGRRRSAGHEAAWLNLLGFCLRPGFGYVMDDWRMDTTWNVLRGKLIHATPEVRSQWWIMWRRIAGGLSGGQQNELAAQLLSSVRQTLQQMQAGRGKGGAIKLHESDAAEIWRVLGALEQLPPTVRRELGDAILWFLSRPRMKAVREPLVWAIGRIGARQPMNGNAQSTVQAETAERWLNELMRLQLDETKVLPLSLMQLARKTHDRLTDVSDSVRDETLRYLREMDASDALTHLVAEGGTTDAETAAEVFGDSLPLGLQLADRR
ncbi:MAG: Hsp70 family protein [Fuerstiella sp.]